MIAAYPDAEVKCNQWGAILQVKDYRLGIQIDWWYDFYSGLESVGRAISYPGESPPPPEPVTRVTDISMTSSRIKGKRTVTAFVAVDDEYWNAAVGATVLVDWTFPNGRAQRLWADTPSSGMARFEVRDGKSGTHTLVVVDVVFFEHRFDSERSVLTSSIKVK